MVATLLYDNEVEKERHLNAIHILAKDMGVPIDAVREFYESELTKLKQSAKIKDFLIVISSRKVKEIVVKMIARGEFR